MLADFEGGGNPAKGGPAGLDAWCREKGIRAVSFEDWKKIDQAEVARGGGKSPRKKFVRTRDMLSIVQQEG